MDINISWNEFNYLLFTRASYVCRVLDNKESGNVRAAIIAVRDLCNTALKKEKLQKRKK